MPQLALDEGFIERQSRLSGGKDQAWLLKDSLQNKIFYANSFTLAAEL